MLLAIFSTCLLDIELRFLNESNVDIKINYLEPFLLEVLKLNK